MVRGTNLGVQLGRSRGNDGRLGVMLGRKQLLYAISSLSAANYYITQPSGGEAGDAAGFGGLYLYVPTTLDAAIRVLGGKTDGSTQGWFPQISANANKASVRGTTAWSEPVGPSLLASDLGRVHAFLMHMTGSFTRVYWDTTSRVTELAITGYTPGAVSEQLGKISSLPATGIHILGRLTFRGNPSLAELQALLDAARTLGDLPTVLGGATLTHRQSVRDALAGLSVVDGQTAPASLPDTVTGAAADAMTRTGSPTVRVIDTSIDGRKTYGAMGWSTSAYLYLAALATSAVTGFHFVIRVRFDLGGSASTRMIIDASSGTTGFQVLCNGATVASGYAWLRTWDGSGVQVDTPTSVGMLATGGGADGGVIYLSGYFDPATNRIEFFTNKTRQTTGAVCTGHSAGNAPLYVGGRPSGLTPYTQTIMDVSYGRTPLTAGEIATMIDASEAAGYLVDVPGKTLYRWPITQAVIAAGGPSAGIPAQVQDRVGTDHLTRVGVKVLQSEYSVETGQADYFRSVPGGGLRGNAGGCVFYSMGRINNLTMSGAAVFAESCGSSSSGWSIQAGSSNFTQLRFAYFDGSGVFRVSSSVDASSVLSAGQLYVFHGVWTGSSLRFYANGAQVGTDQAFTGYTPPLATEPMYIGSRSGTSLAPQNVSHLGVGGASGVPSHAAVAAHAAECISAGRLLAFIGYTDKRYDLRADIEDAGGLPAVSIERTSGADMLVRAGAPLQVAQRVERIYSWEAA